jgi:hypothetical protein
MSGITLRIPIAALPLDSYDTLTPSWIGEPGGAPLARRGRPKPQRRARWLHGLVHHGEEVGAEDIELEVVAEAGAEAGDGLGGVVAAAVDGVLNQATQWLEQRGGD